MAFLFRIFLISISTSGLYFRALAQTPNEIPCRTFLNPQKGILNQYYAEACLILKSQNKQNLVNTLKCVENQVYSPWVKYPKPKDGVAIQFEGDIDREDYIFRKDGCPYKIQSLESYCTEDSQTEDPQNEARENTFNIPNLNQDKIKEIGRSLKEFYSDPKNSKHFILGLGSDYAEAFLNRDFGLGSNCVGNVRIGEDIMFKAPPAKDPKPRTQDEINSDQSQLGTS